tara:strand:+ start:57443 stop:58576 length:1134 start_codon:yes stop_codon:yes gene_type:complete
MITTLIAEQLFDGQSLHNNRPVSFEDGKIISFDTVQGAHETKVSGLLTAGFIDTQVNGGGGYLFNHQTTIPTLKAMVKAHGRYGTSALLPTLITSDLSTLHCAADVISQAISMQLPGVIGVHFEGPHISVPKKGIHSTEHIRQLSKRELELYCRNDLGIKIVTVAPENVSVETIKTLVKNQVIVCLGHSNASYEQTQAALDAGARGFTHLFNAMSPLTSREPNMIGAALLDKTSWCGLILDGHHVHPAAAKLATLAKPKGKMMLVTDSMSTIGSDQSEFEFDGHKIQLSGAKLTSQTGQLAGSALDMITAINHAETMLEVTLSEALRMASLYPAEFLKIAHQQGQLSIGANADFTLLSTINAGHHVTQTWIGGNPIL